METLPDVNMLDTRLARRIDKLKRPLFNIIENLRLKITAFMTDNAVTARRVKSADKLAQNALPYRDLRLVAVMILFI
jgi:hypothetical protein